MKTLIALPLDERESAFVASAIIFAAALRRGDVSILVHDMDDESSNLLQHAIAGIAADGNGTGVAQRIVARIIRLSDASQKA